MKKEFDTASTTQPVPVNSVSVDAVNFIMDNVLDWDAHKEHAGLRMSYDDCKTLAQSLRANLKATCPDVQGDKAVDYYTELLHNNWAGQFSDIKHLTRSIIVAYLDAEVGNRQALDAVTRQMKGKVSFMEAHYPDVSHAQELPVHMLSNAMETKEDNARTAVEGKTAFAQQVCSVIDQGKTAETSYARRKFPGLFKLVGR